ncbi:MAG: DUF5018 domain-containing protein [Tannerella sp.]|jgi:hypothetical protein|nr:DUF5018 domain-containing protein [Tannerella sp.]
MKKIMQLISMMILSACMFSCLDAGLDELPVYTEADIVDFRFEYRYDNPDKTWMDGSNAVEFIRLTTESQVFDSEKLTVALTVRVPEASGTFTENERAKVSLSGLVGYSYISTAALITPVDGAPRLGMPGDFSSPVNYRVTAADGKTVKTWTVQAVLVK